MHQYLLIYHNLLSFENHLPSYNSAQKPADKSFVVAFGATKNLHREEAPVASDPEKWAFPFWNFGISIVVDVVVLVQEFPSGVLCCHGRLSGMFGLVPCAFFSPGLGRQMFAV